MIEHAALRPDYVIPRVIKGGWQLAGGHGAFDRAQAIADMARFADAGLTAFDCADIYTGVEEMIGEFIAGRRRSDIQVHTKLVPDLARLATFTSADVEAIVDRSLKRLRLERLHLVQFFWWDMAVGDPMAVLGALSDIQAKGKIAHLGTTNFNQFDQAKFVAAGLDLLSAQIQYSLLDDRPAGAFADWCGENRISLLCYGSLAGGFLTDIWRGKPDPGYQFENRSLIKYRLIIDEFGGWDLFQELLAVLGNIAERHQTTLAAVAARWVLQQANVASVIIGARTARHLAPTLAILDLELDAADLNAIANIRDQRQGSGGLVYALESDRDGPHGRIMKYNLGAPG